MIFNESAFMKYYICLHYKMLFFKIGNEEKTIKKSTFLNVLDVTTNGQSL